MAKGDGFGIPAPLLDVLIVQFANISDTFKQIKAANKNTNGEDRTEGKHGPATSTRHVAGGARKK